MICRLIVHSDSHELNDIRNIINYPEKRMKSEASNRSLSSSEITFYKLKGEDSQRLIASEKIKRKSDNSLNDNVKLHTHTHRKIIFFVYRDKYDMIIGTT